MVKAEWLEYTFSYTNQKYGSVDAYLTEKAQISATDRENIRKCLLVNL